MFIRSNMEFSALAIVVVAIATLAVLAGMIMLQIYLSKRESKWLGLILPAISFLLALIYPLNIMDTGDLWQNIGLMIMTLLLANIFTVILLVIYAAIRSSRKKKAQLEKMHIQDLG